MQSIEEILNDRWALRAGPIRPGPWDNLLDQAEVLYRRYRDRAESRHLWTLMGLAWATDITGHEDLVVMCLAAERVLFHRYGPNPVRASLNSRIELGRASAERLRSCWTEPEPAPEGEGTGFHLVPEPMIHRGKSEDQDLEVPFWTGVMAEEGDGELWRNLGVAYSLGWLPEGSLAEIYRASIRELKRRLGETRFARELAVRRRVAWVPTLRLQAIWGRPIRPRCIQCGSADVVEERSVQMRCLNCNSITGIDLEET